MEYVSNTKLEYYINTDDRSAAFTAIDNKKFEIYAYLQSVNVKLDETEMDVVRKLSKMEKIELGEEMRPYFPTSEKSHILYLISKSKPVPQNHRKCEDITNFFERLNEIPEICIILKVIEYVNNLEIFFDFDHDKVENMYPAAPPLAKGLTMHNQGSIYIAVGGGRSENEILGTMAHEFTHMAMHLIFDNGRKPFFKSDLDKEKEFEEILNNCKNIEENEDDRPSMVLKTVFGYLEEDQQCELIVRVPHILMECEENREGEKWLSKNTPDLYKFYKENVLPECEKFISENFLLKPRSFIRHLNETEGEVRNIEKCGLRFKNIEILANFVNDPDKNIFVVITKNTWIGLLRIYQAVGEIFHMSHDRFLILKFENFLDNFEDIECAFRSKVLEMLIIECSDALNEKRKILKFVKAIKEKVGKKIIFVIKEGTAEYWYKIIEETKLTNAFTEIEDENISLCDFDNDSQEKILEKIIIFQGREMQLGDLITNDRDLLKCVNCEIIGKLLENKKVEIGEKIFSTSHLDGAYADLSHEINLDMFIQEIKKGDDIFFFDGIDGVWGSNKKKEFVDGLNGEIDISVIDELEDYDRKILSNKKILLTDCKTSDSDFRQICNYNAEKKIYLIETRIKEGKLIFLLKKIYNPDFYLKREFRKTVFINKDILLKDKNTIDNNTIIIVDEADNKEKPEKIEPKVKWLSSGNAKNAFDNLNKTAKAIHLLKMKGDKLIWVESRGSLSELYKYEELNEHGEFWTEDELIVEIINEKVVIFADDSGMGKSTTLTKLYENRNKSTCLADTHWVIRINLRDHIKAINRISSDITSIEEVKQFLKEVYPSLSDKINRNLLNSALNNNKNFPKVLLLAFDGFDELLDESSRKKIIDLTKFLKENSKCKIWITTRLHFRDTLENELSTVAIKFVPLSDISKISFIKNYMKDRLKLISSKEEFDELFQESKEMNMGLKMRIYSERLLKTAEVIFMANVKHFIGTPLQLYLLLEDSIESFRKWVRNRNGYPDFSYLGNNILEVFNRFINIKYDIYFKKKGIDEEVQKSRLKAICESCHEVLSFLQVIKTIHTEKEDPVFIQMKDTLLLIGIIKSKGEHCEFFHFTFGEYFYARRLLSGMLTAKDQVVLNEGAYNIITSIFLRVEFHIVRIFINFLAKDIDRKFFSHNYIKFSENIASLWGQKTDSTFPEGSIFHVAIREYNNYIFRLWFTFEFSLSEYSCILKTVDMNGHTILHLAALTGNEFILNLIIEVASRLQSDDQEELLTMTDTSGRTALDVAIQCGHIEIVEKILKMAERIYLLEKDKLLKLICEVHGSKSPFSSIGRSCLFSHFEITKFLFEEIISNIATKQQIEELFDAYSDSNCGLRIFLFAAKEGHIEIFKFIFQKLESTLNKQKLYKIFDSAWFTLIEPSAVPDCNLIKYLVEVAEHTFPDKTSDTLLKKENALFYALHKNRPDIVKILFKNEKSSKDNLRLYELISKGHRNGLNLLHRAATDGRFEIVAAIFEMVEKYLSLTKLYELLFKTDDLGQTVLHIAIPSETHDLQPNKETTGKLQDEAPIQDPPKSDHEKTFKLIFEKLRLEKQFELLYKKNNNQQTSLHYCCMAGNVEILKTILAKKDSYWKELYKLMRMKNHNGHTALHLAAFFGKSNVVKLLLEELKKHLSKEEFKKYLIEKDAHNYTPIELANRNKHFEICKMISKAFNS